MEKTLNYDKMLVCDIATKARKEDVEKVVLSKLPPTTRIVIDSITLKNCQEIWVRFRFLSNDGICSEKAFELLLFKSDFVEVLHNDSELSNKYKCVRIGDWVAFKQKGMKETLHGRVDSINGNKICTMSKKGRVRYTTLDNVIGITIRPNKTNPKPPIFDFNGELIYYNVTKKCEITICDGEEKQKIFVSYLRPYEIEIIEKSIRGEYNNGYNIYDEKGNSYDVGIVDKIAYLEK